jgi:chloramphenicol O-acetyltransferase type A
MDYPQYNLCFNIDVTNFVRFVKVEKLSFYYSLIHAVTKTINEIEEFRYRIRNGKVILHELIHPSFTDMDPEGNDDLFKMVTPDFVTDLKQFEKLARKESINQKEYFNPEKLIGRDDLIYITCIPWISFTHISHTIRLDKNDSVPRLSWGKYFQEGKKTLLPFSIQVHHALVDGYHVGRYVKTLQEDLDKY